MEIPRLLNFHDLRYGVRVISVPNKILFASSPSRAALKTLCGSYHPPSRLKSFERGAGGKRERRGFRIIREMSKKKAQIE